MGWAETAAFGYLRERLVGTAGPQGTFGYPATCAVVNGERRSPTLKSRRGLSFPIYWTARRRCFLGTPGNRPAPKAATSLHRFFLKRLSGRLQNAGASAGLQPKVPQVIKAILL